MSTASNVIGAGNMGRGIASVAARGGNTVTIVDHEPADAADLANELQRQYPDATIAPGTLDQPLGDVVLAVWYTATQDLVRQLGDRLRGKVLVDISNPLTETFDGLALSGDTSAAEELAKVAPGARVVKAFNTTFAGTLQAGQVADQVLDVLVAGDEPDAKAAVVELVKAGGLRGTDVGPLERARQLEG